MPGRTREWGHGAGRKNSRRPSPRRWQRGASHFCLRGTCDMLHLSALCFSWQKKRTKMDAWQMTCRRCIIFRQKKKTHRRHFLLLFYHYLSYSLPRLLPRPYRGPCVHGRRGEVGRTEWRAAAGARDLHRRELQRLGEGLGLGLGLRAGVGIRSCG